MVGGLQADFRFEGGDQSAVKTADFFGKVHGLRGLLLA